MSPGKRHGADGFMPEIFLLLLFLCAVLALLVLGPARSPSFEDLTEFSCDSHPLLPSVRWSAGSRAGLYTLCRSDHQVAHFGGSPIATNAAQWRRCLRGGGIVKIWRPELPSAYGAYTFQITCNGEVVVSYKDASASYESRRAFVGILAWCLLASTSSALVGRVIHAVKRKRRGALADD